MRYRLSTLLIALGILPMLLGAMWWVFHDLSALDDATALGKAVIAVAIFAAIVVPISSLVCLLAGAFVKNR